MLRKNKSYKVLAGGQRRLVHHSFVSVVAEQLVTPRLAPSTGFGFRESYRKLPFGKGDLVPNVAGVVGGMRVVTRPAGPSFDHFIYMNEMEVLVAVSETGQSRGPLVVGNIFFMAHKAELVIILAVARIKELWEELPQHPEVCGTMRIVTA